MLRLSLDTQKPRWLALPHGVRVEVRPITTAVIEAAYAEVQERLRPLKKAAEDAAAAGMPLDPAGANGANAAWLQGLAWQYQVEALARYGILRWEGLADMDDNPLPVSPAAVAAFAAHPDLGREFWLAYRATLSEVEAEGNGSAPSSGGDGAGAPNTAEAAPAEPDFTEATTTESPAPTAPQS